MISILNKNALAANNQYSGGLGAALMIGQPNFTVCNSRQSIFRIKSQIDYSELQHSTMG